MKRAPNTPGMRWALMGISLVILAAGYVVAWPLGLRTVLAITLLLWANNISQRVARMQEAAAMEHEARLVAALDRAREALESGPAAPIVPLVFSTKNRHQN